MTDTPTVSPFSAESLRSAVEEYFKDIPPDHVAATVQYRVSDGTVRLASAARIGDQWRIGGNLAWNLKTGRVVEGSIRVIGSWA